jgi:hypothetical protein
VDQVTFLSTGWEKVSRESGHQEEQRIWEALRKEVEQGLAFEALWNQDDNEAWRVIGDIIVSSSQLWIYSRFAFNVPHTHIRILY